MSRENAVRYDGERRDHVESYFLKATAPTADRAVWIKATILSSREGPAVVEGWAIAFDRRPGKHAVGSKHRLPFREARFGASELDIAWRIPGGDEHFTLAPGRARGLIANHGATRHGPLRWELSLDGAAAPLELLPSPKLYDASFPSSKTVTPFPDLAISGTFCVGDNTWELDRWSGMQGHNWGVGHAEHYAWTHCNQWNEPDALVLEAVTARVRIAGQLLPPLTSVCIRHAGEDHAFNGPLSLLTTRAQLGLRRYGFSAANRGGRVDAVIDASVEDFVGLHYENPTGAMTHCLNAKLARARVRFEPRGGVPITLSTSAAALEVGTLRSDHGVRMIL